MHSGCLHMLAARDVDTSSQLLLSLSDRVKSMTLNGATRSTWTRRRYSRSAERSPWPESQPKIQESYRLQMVQ